MTSPSRRLLIVMARDPAAGSVKTRLQPPLTPEESAALYECFLRDRLEEASLLTGIDVAVAFTPAGAGEALAAFVPSAFRLFPQRGDTLTERLAAATSSAFAEGYGTVAVTDSDSPDLPGEYILQAFRLLEGEADAVFGPCRDGGYYLAGLRKERPGIFEDIPWSTSRVLEASLARAASMGLRTACLPPWQDIDTFDDLREFALRHARGADGAAPCRRTLAFLEEMRIFAPGDVS